MKAIIFGCGYLGIEIARLLISRGIEVCAFRRSKEELDSLASLGCQTAIGDLNRLEDLAQLPACYEYVINVAASGGGDAAAYRKLYVEGNRNILRWLAFQGDARFVYTSSTSVYGQNDGSVLNEESAVEPQAETSKVLREAEELVLGGTGQTRGMVLRLAGIYGPGRGFYLKKFAAQEPLSPIDAERYTNMIHVEDAATAILQALLKGKPGEVYNICDDQPTKLGEIFSWVSEVTHSPAPPVSETASTAPRKRGASNKRISNKKARSELDWNLKYPTYKEGFRHELIQE